MTQHSILPPSSAARRVACPGSWALEQHYPETESSASAREGDAAHWVAAETLKESFFDVHGADLDIAPNGEPVTQEMEDGADLLVNDIFELVEDVDLRTLKIEQPISIANIHPEMWGTPDAWVYKPGTLWIWDYKFGHGYVDVFENWQLIAYAAGILNHLGINGLADQYTEVRMRIVQPRCYHRDGTIREWAIKASALRPYFNILQQAEAAATAPNAPAKPGKHCGHCRGRHACEALQRAALDTIDLSGSNTPHDLTPTALGTELYYLKQAAARLDARINGLSSQAESLLQKGQPVPHFKLERTNGREYWTKSVEEVTTLGQLCGVELTKPALITPNQAIKAGVDAKVVKLYSARSAGTIKLVEFDDGTTRKIFTQEDY